MVLRAGRLYGLHDQRMKRAWWGVAELVMQLRTRHCEGTLCRPAFQYFPRSQQPPSHLMAVVDAFRSVETELTLRYQLWNDWASSSPKAPKGPRLESDVVLDLVSNPLKAAGYDVETKGHILRIVVLWGVNGTPVKSYEADAKLEHEPGRETVVEVEAGGATANNLWRKDLTASKTTSPNPKPSQLTPRRGIRTRTISVDLTAPACADPDE